MFGRRDSGHWFGRKVPPTVAPRMLGRRNSTFQLCVIISHAFYLDLLRSGEEGADTESTCLFPGARFGYCGGFFALLVGHSASASGFPFRAPDHLTGVSGG